MLVNALDPSDPAPTETDHGGAVRPAQRRLLRLAVASAVAVVLLVLALALLYSVNPSKGPSTEIPGRVPGSNNSSLVEKTLVDTGSGTLEAGPPYAVVTPVSIPASQSAPWIQGWFNLTGCGSPANCTAYAWLISPANWTKYLNGSTVGVAWCTATNGHCMAVQDTFIDAGSLGGLTRYEGSTLDLVFFSSATMSNAIYSAHVTLGYTPPPPPA